MLNVRKDIIDFFEKGIFPCKGNLFKTKEEESEEKLEEESKQESEERIRKFVKDIENESKGINYELFEKHFNFVTPSALVKQLYETKNKNNQLVNIIKSGLSDWKDESRKIPEDEINEIEIIEEIRKFNKQNQSGEGLKILSPNQMLSRLPISLAQLNAGNNSEKLKNEIRQLLYSLYRSKKLTK